MMCICNSLCAQRNILDLMRDENYINASIIIVSPGTAIYSAGGHLALRMQCPLQNTDYIYEFDATLKRNESLLLNYLNGYLMGEYVRLFSSDFFDKVVSQNRTFDEYKLNLTPEQKVTLWSNLDNSVDSNYIYPFTPSEYNCCSMILSVIEASVQPGLLSSYVVSDDLHGSCRKYLNDFFYNSPWTGLFWNIILGLDFDKYKDPIFLYYPKVIGKYISLIENPANREKLIEYKTHSINFTDNDKSILTPSLTFIILIIVTCCLTYMNLRGKLIRLTHCFDISLIVLTSIIGCVLWYMALVSLFNGPLYLNILMLLFSPIPFVLLYLKRTTLWLLYIKIITITCFILLINTFFIKQIQLYFLWLFIASIFIRGIFNIYSKSHV